LQTLTNTLTPLANSTPCKSVTLINLSTNVKFTYSVNPSVQLTLEAGYSVKINTSNSGDVQIAQFSGEGNVCQIIITQ
jgi:hypothetical protein